MSDCKCCGINGKVTERSVIPGTVNMKSNIIGTVNAKEAVNGTIMATILKGLSAYEVAVANGFEGTEEEWLASLKGDKGDQGEQGIQGVQGEKGDRGEAATIAIGTVVVGDDASVVNSGDSHNAVFDFVIPRGPKINELAQSDILELYCGTATEVV